MPNALPGTIYTSRMRAPAFRRVLVGMGDFTNGKTDGVHVVSIGCLKD